MQALHNGGGVDEITPTEGTHEVRIQLRDFNPCGPMHGAGGEDGGDLGSVTLGNRNGIRNPATLSHFPTLLQSTAFLSRRPPQPPCFSVSDVEPGTRLRLAVSGPPSKCSLGVGGSGGFSHFDKQGRGPSQKQQEGLKSDHKKH